MSQADAGTETSGGELAPESRRAPILFRLTCIGCVGALILAAWPGILEQLVFGLPACFCIFPIVAVWGLGLCVAALEDLFREKDPLRQQRRWGLLAAAVVAVSVGLVIVRVPARIGFWISQSHFQPLVGQVPEEFELRGTELNRRLGLYWVDRYGEDPRGGVYFRTQSGLRLLDLMSYGFAYKPNPEGAPFGSTRYRLTHLFGDWYSFSVSEDSF